MGKTKCKTEKNKDIDPVKQKEDKYLCKKCNRTANKERKLCKPTDNK